jgi:hypothetical protein
MAFVVLGALSAALLSVGSSEVQIASNHLHGTQAFFLAEAGLEHAFNTLMTPSYMTNANATLQNIIPTTQLGGAGSYTAQYQKAGDYTWRVVSTGVSAIGGSQAIRRAVMSTYFHSNDAILTDGNLTIAGSTGVLATGGTCGNVHTNNNLSLTGSAIDIFGNATASGTYNTSGNPSVGTGSGPNKPTQTIPVINPTDFLNIAIATLPANQVFQMKANGQVLNGSGGLITTLVSGDSYNGWGYTPGTTAEWRFSGSAGNVDGTYYFEGNVTLSGSPGGGPGSPPPPPWVTTLIATGNITVTGGPKIQTRRTDTLFIAGLDIDMHGNPANTAFSGLIAAHEQFNLGGDVTINGFLIAEDAGSTSSVVTSNTVSGSPQINYSCNLNPPLQGPLQFLSWGL